jgi:hypothetical protein
MAQAASIPKAGRRFMVPVCGPVKRNSTLLGDLLQIVASRSGRPMPASLLCQPEFAAFTAPMWPVVARVG